jgi:uncharacterized protein
MAESTVTPERALDPGAAAGRSPRNATLDILRGLALVGMVIAHVYKLMGNGAVASAADEWSSQTITLGIAEKDRAMFAFLFGASFALMLRKLESGGLPVVSIFLRRLLVLYLIGFVLEVLTPFHILREYAWWGLPLVFLRASSTRTLLALAAVSATAYAIRDVTDSTYAIATSGYEQIVAEETAKIERFAAEQHMQAVAEGSANYGEAMGARLRRVIRELPSPQWIMPNVYLALFLLGLLAIRHGIFDAPQRHRRLIRRFMAVGVLAWAAYWWLLPMIPFDFAPPRIARQAQVGFGLAEEQYLAFTYLGAITLLIAYRPKWESWLAPLAWIGRLALTNYVLQAALIDFAASAYGLQIGLSPSLVIPAATALIVAQIALSRFWLARFKFGPIEWLWRSLTYWRWQPNRIGSDRPASAQ